MEDTEATLKPGTMLDRYELLCALASGGMATVWLARMRGKRGFEKLLAVKTIRSELSDDPHFEEMFLDEARIAAKIQHPNVAQIIDLGEQDEVLYLVMEWVDGEALSKVRRFAGKKGAQVPLGIALRIIADACAGLHAAHELADDDGKLLGVVHRDVSPQNILVSTSGTVKVIDFGVAKATNRLAPETRSGIIKGKLQYMAPEQALGRPIDRRVDIWALGVCLYELVADKLPFDGDNQLEILQKLSADTPPEPIAGAVPAMVEEILARSLARKPDERFDTAAAMRRAIEIAMAELDLPSASEDVATFVAAHLPDRAAKRQELVSRALRDAGVRSKSIAIVLQEENVGAFDGTVEVDVSRPRTSAIPTRVTGVRRKAALVVDDDEEPPPSKPSSATLGSAAVVESKKDLMRAIPRSRTGTWVAALLVVGAVASGAFVWREYGERLGSSGGAPSAPSSSASTATFEPTQLPPRASSSAPSASSSSATGVPAWAYGKLPPRSDASAALLPIPTAPSASAPTPAALSAAIASASASAPAASSGSPPTPPSASAPPAPSAAPTSAPSAAPDPAP